MDQEKLDRIDDICDELRGISQLLYTVGENIERAENSYDTYSELVFLGRSIELIGEQTAALKK